MKHTDRFVAVVIVFAALVYGSTPDYTGPAYAAAPTGHFKVFRVPTAGVQPRHITAGPDGNVWFADGNMWFTESDQNANVAKIGRIDAAGNVTEFAVPNQNSGPDDIVSGPDGALWFTGASGFPDFFIGRITTAGQMTGFSPCPPTAPCSIVPGGIASGPDGNLWFTEDLQNAVVRLTPAGTFTFFPIPTPAANPSGITRGPDGALWFAENGVSQIGRVDTIGNVVEFGGLTGRPDRITLGPDGNLWFTELFDDIIGRITPTGGIMEFPLPAVAGLTGLSDIVAGTDGNLWFTEFNTEELSQMTTAGVVTDVQKARGGPFGIGRGPDGAIWLTLFSGDKVGRFSLR